MRLKHWVFIGFVLVGLLYVVHMFTSHGGMTGFTSGLGLGSGTSTGTVGRMGA